MNRDDRVMCAHGSVFSMKSKISLNSCHSGLKLMNEWMPLFSFLFYQIRFFIEFHVVIKKINNNLIDFDFILSLLITTEIFFSNEFQVLLCKISDWKIWFSTKISLLTFLTGNKFWEKTLFEKLMKNFLLNMNVWWKFFMFEYISLSLNAFLRVRTPFSINDCILGP